MRQASCHPGKRTLPRFLRLISECILQSTPRNPILVATRRPQSGTRSPLHHASIDVSDRVAGIHQGRIGQPAHSVLTTATAASPSPVARHTPAVKLRMRHRPIVPQLTSTDNPTDNPAGNPPLTPGPTFRSPHSPRHRRHHLLLQPRIPPRITQLQHRVPKLQVPRIHHYVRLHVHHRVQMQPLYPMQLPQRPHHLVMRPLVRPRPASPSSSTTGLPYRPPPDSLP